MIRRLAAIPGITKHQTGDNEGRPARLRAWTGLLGPVAAV